ncbi:RNA polymerase sigma factor [Flexithrix dorotheae]|uniref:RNA polymerase sigma factor n=1 Tax=Flexithrix dorotheae TaxID=70993 RepID=UPI000365E683|nr:RNA polymerase sigma factor [Flexithrix dorotheae]
MKDNLWIKMTHSPPLTFGKSIGYREISEDELTQEALLVEAAKKDTKKFRVLYQRYFKQIFQFIFNRVGEYELTSDLSSQVFLKALTNLSKYRHQKLPFSAWLFRIAINEVNQFYRKNKKQRKVVLDETLIQQLKVAKPDENLEYFKEKLSNILQKLSPKEIQIIELRYFTDASFKDISQILNISESAAKVRVHRLIKKIKDLWD